MPFVAISTPNDWQYWIAPHSRTMRMGYEYKIVLSVTDEEKEGLIDFVGQLKSKNDSLARHAPPVTLQQEDDGLYVCQYLSSNVWQGLEALRQYLAERKLKYRVEEL